MTGNSHRYAISHVMTRESSGSGTSGIVYHSRVNSAHPRSDRSESDHWFRGLPDHPASAIRCCYSGEVPCVAIYRHQPAHVDSTVDQGFKIIVLVAVSANLLIVCYSVLSSFELTQFEFELTQTFYCKFTPRKQHCNCGHCTPNSKINNVWKIVFQNEKDYCY